MKYTLNYVSGNSLKEIFQCILAFSFWTTFAAWFDQFIYVIIMGFLKMVKLATNA